MAGSPAEQKNTMKKIIFGILPLAAGLLVAGCTPHHAMVVTTEPTPSGPVTTETTRTVVVTQEPPALRTEIEGTAPSEGHVWIQGYWTYSHGNWVWMPGHWELRPRTNAMWVPGHWDKNPEGKGWIWTAGHWE
jgi:hypothetical protein